MKTNKLTKITGAIILSASLFTASHISASDTLSIKDAHGFKVLNQYEKANHTTIVSRIVLPSSLGFDNVKGELGSINMFDDTDFTVLTKKQAKGLKTGDIVLITYNGDHVVKVEKNKKKINVTVNGQTIE